jgi:hypothetical protein
LIAWPYCLAYLTGTGIPEEIRAGEVDHTLPHPGDHGIQYLPDEDPYELSEPGLKALLLECQGETIMPDLLRPHRAHADQSPSPAPEVSPAQGYDNSELLLKAAAAGDVGTVRGLLDAGVDVDAMDKDGETALMVACRNCQVDTVKLLLERGADAGLQDKFARDALYIATVWGYPSLVEILKAHGATEDTLEQRRPVPEQ